jgi:hypothetical protein
VITEHQTEHRVSGRAEDADLADQLQKVVADVARSEHTASDIERLLSPEALEQARSLARRIQSGTESNPEKITLNELLALGWFHWYRFLLPEGRDQEDFQQSLTWFSGAFPYAPEAVPERVRDYFQEAQAPTGPSPADEAMTMATERYEAYARTGETAQINAAIDLFREAVAATPAGHLDRAGHLSNLGAALQMRFEGGGAVDDVNEAIVVGREAVAAAGAGDRPGVLSNLGNALRRRFEGLAVIDDVDEAIDVLRDAVAGTPTGSPNLAGVLSNLGTVLLLRFDRLGAADDVDEAIIVGRASVAATAADHPGRAVHLSILGAALQSRFERGGALGDLDEAIDVVREAVAATAAGDPGRAGHLSILGGALQLRFDRGGAIDDLDESIDVRREAVAASPASHPDRASYLSFLGSGLRRRFERVGAIEDVDEAIDVLRQAVAATPTGQPDRAGRLSNLGTALQMRFERVGAVDDLDETIDVVREAVATTPAGHPRRAARLLILGVALRRRFERVGAVGDIDEVVDVARKAVAGTPAGHADRAWYLSFLGTALQMRFERGGAVEDVDEAIDVVREVLAATPAGHPDRGGHLSLLGTGLRLRFEESGVASDVDEAIVVGREAVSTTPASDRNLPARQSNLGTALRRRFERGGPVEDLNEAIDVVRQAVAATPAGDPDLADRLSNLGASLWRRFERTGAVEDVDEAIVVGRESVAATHAGHPGRGGHLSNLGAALRRRFQRIGAVADLDEAILVGREAVTAALSRDRDLPVMLGNLGVALRRRFERVGAVEDADEAIDVARQAVAATPTGHPDRAGRLSMLGTALQLRFEHGGALDDVDEAILVGREAVAATRAGNRDLPAVLANLGVALRRRFERVGAVEDADEAIDVVRQAVAVTVAGHPDLAGHLYNLGIILQLRFERGGAVDHLDEAKECFRTAADVESAAPSLQVLVFRHLGEVQRLAGERPEIVAASLRRAVVLHSEEVAPGALDWQDREHLLGEHSGLVTEAIAAHLDANDLDGALEAAELGRAVLLSYATEDRSDLTLLRELDGELADAFETVVRDLNDSPPLTRADGRGAMADVSFEPVSLKTWRQRRQQAGVQRRRLLSEIRNLPGMDSFLGTPPAQELLDGLPAEGHVVLVNVSGLRCDALLCSRNTPPVPVALTELTASDVRDQVINLMGAMRDSRPLAGQIRRQRVIGEVLAWLWDTTVGPVLDQLPTTDHPPRVWWVPTGLMAALPLHAAAPRSGPGALEQTVSSYTPSIRSLTGSSQARTPELGRMLVASLPETPGVPADGRRPARPAARDLPGTIAEAKVLQSPGLLPLGLTVDALPGARASLVAVTDSLREATWAHLACHADADPTQPSNGRLLLHDGDLTIPELARLRLDHAQLAYLSACSTAVGGLRQADEVITVATAFRIAGFRHVIGTLWPLGDDIAPVAAKLFYEALGRLFQTEPEPDDDCYAYALHQTVTELRNQGFKPHQWAQLVHIGP